LKSCQKIRHQKIQQYAMKHADKPFIGILIVTIAILYGVIALLS
jgi:hypothetical protein